MFDYVRRKWEPLGAEMTQKHRDISIVPVAGGLIVAGGSTVPEMYDEESGRWVKLPHQMVEQREAGELISVPAFTHA